MPSLKDYLFYQDDWVMIYCGDCREILPMLGSLETIITDPVWPDSDVPLIGSENPYALFAAACDSIQETKRIVVQLGCDSDVRFLLGVPPKYPFLRVCWLEYVCPSYKGRILYTGDVAYAFGEPPAYIPGRQLISGKCTSTKPDKMFRRGTGSFARKAFTGNDNDKLPHPCARRLEHVKWLVHQFSDKTVCDPFLGSGTTCLAAKELGLKSIGIEIKSQFCEVAVKRLRQEVFNLIKIDRDL